MIAGETAMCKINFVSEFREFMRYAMQNGLSARERNLWIALFYLANDRARYNEQTGDYDWPDDFFLVANSELNLHSTLDKRGIDTVRNTLKQRGLIDFKPGERNKRQPAYKMHYLSLGINIGYNNAPNTVPRMAPAMYPRSDQGCTQGASNDAPKIAPFYINKDNDIGINLSLGLEDFKKRFDINDNYMESSKARAATTQRLLDIIGEARPGLIGQGTQMFDRINKALLLELTPYWVYRMAGECRDWLDFMGVIEEPPEWLKRQARLEQEARYKQG